MGRILSKAQNVTQASTGTPHMSYSPRQQRCPQPWSPCSGTPLSTNSVRMAVLQHDACISCQNRHVLQGTTGGGLGEGGIAAVHPPGRHPQGPGLDPGFLALQVRKLQKKHKGLVRELQAAAAREAFWKSSTQSAQQALDEVSVVILVSFPNGQTSGKM